MNTSVLAKLEQAFADLEDLPGSIVSTFFNSDVSVTFMDVTYPVQYTWSASNTTDATAVIAGDICIGYPRHLSSDPSNIPVFKALRLSRALRPVLV
jgi:hypothetical protein